MAGRGSNWPLPWIRRALGDRFVVLAISIVFRGCAVSVAWKVLKAEEKHAWKPEWLALLKQFKELLPAGWMVIVLANRGLYAKWLFEAIVDMKWHPFLRVNSQGSFRPEGWYHWKPFSDLVPSKGKRWQGRGIAFGGKKTQLNCTLLGYWGENHEDPWLILTDLAPECADACWYGLRAWIEQGFKHSKRSGWQWQHTRMDDPARAERLWMAIAIVGGCCRLAAKLKLKPIRRWILQSLRFPGRRVCAEHAGEWSVFFRTVGL